jgi:hypothetical protein
VNDVAQVFIVQQPHSWAPLGISQNLMQTFFDNYNVFASFWKCLFTFGRRSEEGEFKFPTHTTQPLINSERCFSSRGKISSVTASPIFYPINTILTSLKGTESSYVLRRAELHGRTLLDGQSPWSIRQTAVYHQYNLDTNSQHDHETQRSTFLLIAPSPCVVNKISQCCDIGVIHPHAISPFSLQSILVADSLKGWMRYMTWLEGELNKQVIPIAFTHSAVTMANECNQVN